MTSELGGLLRRHVEAGTVPGAIGLLGTAEPEVVAVGVSAVGGPPLAGDAIVRIQSMTKAVTAVAALRLVAAGRLGSTRASSRGCRSWPGAGCCADPPPRSTRPSLPYGPITLRHLLTNGSGTGWSSNGPRSARRWSRTGPRPVRWSGRAGPTRGSPGWRRCRSRSRRAGLALPPLLRRPRGPARPASPAGPSADHLAADLFGPLGLSDTGFWVPERGSTGSPRPTGRGRRAGRDRARGGGPYAGPPDVDVSHGELVSTARDYHRFLRALAGATDVAGAPLLSDEHRRLMHQRPGAGRAQDAGELLPGLLGRRRGGASASPSRPRGRRRGRFGWSGGQGTDFFVDPDGTIGILLTQVELGEEVWPLVEEFQASGLPSS